MMKSRSIELSKLETSLKSSPRRHDQPAWQSSPRKASPTEPPWTSPSYMRSTRSSEAKKEQMKVGNSGSSKLQRVAKSLSRVSSLKRVRTLKTRNKYVQSHTCSSTLKEMKFPTKLILDPGATEAGGGSVVKVCSYSHCSLNRHDHTPLRCFLTLKRKLLKTQKLMPFTPVQDQAAFKWSYRGTDYLEECNSVTVEVDESFGKSLDMGSKEGKISGTWPDKKGKVLAQSENGDDYLKVVLGNKLVPYHHQEITGWQHFSDVDSVSDCKSTMPGEQQFEEPIVLKEEDRTTSALENEIAREDSSFVHGATICYTNPEVKSTDEQGGSFSGLVSELIEGRDEFKEKKAKNDAEQKENVDLSNDHSVTDWKSIQTGRVQLKEENIIKEENEVVRRDSSLVCDSIICHTCSEIESIDKQRSCLSDRIDEITEVRDEDVAFCKYPTKADGDEGSEEHHTGGEIGGTVNALTIEESKSTNNTIKPILRKINGVEFISIKEDSKIVNSSQGEFEHREAGNGAEQKQIKPNKSILEISTSKDQNGLNMVKLNPNKYSFEVQATEVDDIGSTEEIDAFLVIRDRTALTKHSCNKFKRSKRCKKSDEESMKAREVSPQAPKFLPVEPDPEAERVVLRHQGTDERRSAEEWMLDYALQKVVNRLASARTRNVALLVEAFETVFPKSNFEPHSRGK